MPKLPVISGREVIKRLSKVCYKVVRIRGSHCKLKRTKMLVVPLHPELAKSTLKAILNEIELNEGIPQQVIRRLLRGEQVDISCPEKR